MKQQLPIANNADQPQQAQKRRRRHGTRSPFQSKKPLLALHMTLLVFAIMATSAIIVGGMMALLLHFGLVDFKIFNPLLIIIVMLLTSVAISTILSAFISRKAFRQANAFISAMQKIAGGDFTVRLKPTRMPKYNDILDNFNHMVEELGSIETLRSDFVSNFSHEFKTPIVSIRGFAKLLKDPSLTEEQRNEYLNIIFEESSRLSELAESTLLMSRLESLELVGKKTKFAIDEQIRRSILLLENEWSKKQLDLNINLENIDYFGNEDLIKQLILNLFSNAIKFTPEHGTIAVSARRVENENIIISISDSGCGMDEEVRQHIFDKFYQGDSSHATPGNGLGLAIVSRIVDIVGGELKVTSEIGKGSTFTVILPIEEGFTEEN